MLAITHNKSPILQIKNGDPGAGHAQTFIVSENPDLGRGFANVITFNPPQSIDPMAAEGWKKVFGHERIQEVFNRRTAEAAQKKKGNNGKSDSGKSDNGKDNTSHEVGGGPTVVGEVAFWEGTIFHEVRKATNCPALGNFSF